MIKHKCKNNRIEFCYICIEEIQKENKLLVNFLKEIIKEKDFSIYNYWHLIRKIKKFLKEIKEINNETI